MSSRADQTHTLPAQGKTRKNKRNTSPDIGTKKSLTYFLAKQGIENLDFNFHGLWTQGTWRRDELLRERGEEKSRSTREQPSEETETWYAYSSLDATSGWQPSRLLEVSVNLSGHTAALAGSK